MKYRLAFRAKKKGLKRRVIGLICFVGALCFLSFRQFELIRLSLQNGAFHTLESSTAIDFPAEFLTLVQDPDRNCPFRNSTIYRKVYVYPSPGSNEWIHNESGVVTGKRTMPGKYPWDEIDERCRQQGSGIYDVTSQLAQYSTELLVREIIMNPDSCLRTNNPETASLFYVPYLPATEFHNGSLFARDYSTSPYGRALLEALEFRYDSWEATFGLTSKFWQRRNGSDHILVFSEPMHGLSHPKNRRGNFHFVNSQKQLAPPIVVSVELSTTFVHMYPHCARKNILMPYPNTDGQWFNSKLDVAVEIDILKSERIGGVMESTHSPAMLEAEKQLAKLEHPEASEWMMRPKRLSQYYKAGAHGTCTGLRKALAADHDCTEAGKLIAQTKMSYAFGYRQASFCPCPGGDSPSAKRMYDALHGGCIPVVLSYDFVWPFTEEFDIVTGNHSSEFRSNSPSILINPGDFSVRVDASDYSTARNDRSCILFPDAPDKGLQSLLESFSPSEIRRLRQGVAKASDIYAYYKRRKNLPDNPLRDGIVPDGGAAHALVNALGERSKGRRWPSCKEELQIPRKDDVLRFKC